MIIQLEKEPLLEGIWNYAKQTMCVLNMRCYMWQNFFCHLFWLLNKKSPKSIWNLIKQLIIKSISIDEWLYYASTYPEASMELRNNILNPLKA